MALFRKTSLKAEHHAQCKALTPWPRTGERVRLDQHPSWLETQACERILASTHSRDICWWPELSGLLLQNWKMRDFVRACVFLGSPCITWARSWKKHLADREHRQPGHTKSTNRPSQGHPTGIGSPKGSLLPLRAASITLTLLSMTEAGYCATHCICKERRFFRDFCILKLITLFYMVATYQL